MTPRFTILIPTLTCRREMLGRLLEVLRPQADAHCFRILIQEDAGEMTIGEKRNALIDRAATAGSDFVAFVDDDDMVSPDYCQWIRAALEHDPAADCIGFRSMRYMDGQRLGECMFSIQVQPANLQLSPRDWQFYRSPQFPSPVRIEHAAATRCLPQCWGEERDYARRILPRLKAETYIDRVLHHYYLRSPEARSGETCHPERRGPRPLPPRSSNQTPGCLPEGSRPEGTYMVRNRDRGFIPFHNRENPCTFSKTVTGPIGRWTSTSMPSSAYARR